MVSKSSATPQTCTDVAVHCDEACFGDRTINTMTDNTFAIACLWVFENIKTSPMR
jgi:hypothetical protein